MNLAQLRTPSSFIFALAAANLTLLAQDSPKPDRAEARDPHAERSDRDSQPDKAPMMQERLERMKREIGELREAGKIDEAREKERNFAEVMRKLKEDGRGQREPDHRMTQERLTRMKQEIAELREAGKTEQAQEMERNLQAAVRQLSQDRPPQVPQRGGERMQHLEQAIQHVEAAGLPEVSRDLRKVADQLREDMRRQEREASNRREALGGERGEINDLRRELERNREEMQRMQREIRELRAKAGTQ